MKSPWINAYLMTRRSDLVGAIFIAVKCWNPVATVERIGINFLLFRNFRFRFALYYSSGMGCGCRSHVRLHQNSIREVLPECTTRVRRRGRKCEDIMSNSWGSSYLRNLIAKVGLRLPGRRNEKYVGHLWWWWLQLKFSFLAWVLCIVKRNSLISWGRC